jgi:hypothetical protein
MKSSIGTFLLRFAAIVVLFAPDGFARDPNSVNLCPPSLRITEQDGCQPSNGPKSGTPSAPIKDDAAEQWKQIVSAIKNTSLEVQSCIWRGPLRSGWTLDRADAEIFRCQREVDVSDLIRSIPSPEVRSCVWTGPLRNSLTLDSAGTEISRCQISFRNRNASINEGLILKLPSFCWNGWSASLPASPCLHLRFAFGRRSQPVSITYSSVSSPFGCDSIVFASGSSITQSRKPKIGSADPNGFRAE